ncbi:MAG: polyphosphate kinase 1 [Oscillospiraceae bacterium]
MKELIDDLVQEKPTYYVNRELSWLKFNERVLEEARDTANPLCERLNFVSIFQSNLDEFFMVRVGTLVDSLDAGVTDDKTGMTSAQQISAILARTGPLLSERDKIYKSLMQELSGYGVQLCRFGSLQDKTQAYLEKYFMSDVLPLLSPQIIGRKQPFPFLRNKAIYAVAMLKTKSGSSRMGIVPCGDGALRRLVPLPGEGLRFVLMEELIIHFLPKVFLHYKIEGSALIRLVRNADINVDDNVSDADDMSAEDYRKTMEKLIRRRTKLSPVKLEYKGKMDDNVRSNLCRYLGLSKKHIFQSDIPLDLSFIGFLRDVLRDKTELFYPRRVPQNSVNIDANEPMVPQIRRRDILLNYPYESMRPFLRLLNEAGQDPHVVSIKMTLYRVANNSKIIEALVDAAENGKEVVVLVELRARFDEENNIGWSRVLEQAGCRVIYGLDRMKVHSKLLLITRVHDGQVEYITQVGTGNYNEDTVKLYTDYALMTASPEIGAEAAMVFNCLSMGEVVENTKYLLVAPQCLRSRILELIDTEIELAKSGEPAYLGFKLNGMTDKGIIDKLVEASRAGVQVDLLIRGICCMLSGLPEISENIHIYSIVGRYLEHSRIYIFGTAGRRKVYLSSADFMTRNTMRRVEVAVPVYDDDIRHHVERMFFEQLSDTAKLRVQQPDGVYVHVAGEGTPFNSQEHFYEEAYSGAWVMKQAQEPEKVPEKEDKSTKPDVNEASAEKEPSKEKPAVPVKTNKTAAASRTEQSPGTGPAGTRKQPVKTAVKKTEKSTGLYALISRFLGKK